MNGLKRLLPIILAIFMVISTSACKPKSDSKSSGNKQITLTLTHDYTTQNIKNDNNNKLFHEMIEDFEKANPNIKISVTEMSQDNYTTKIQAQEAAGDLPDLFFLKGSWANTFVDNKLLSPINEFIDNSGYKDKYRTGIFDPVTINGKIYGSPIQYSVTSLVFYNSTMWKSIGYNTFPDNWNDFESAIAKFKAKGITPLALGNKDKWPYESCILSCLGDRYTGTDWTKNIIKNNGKAKFTDKTFIDALSFSQKLAKSGTFNSDYNSVTDDQATTYYCNGKTAAIIDGFWDVDYINNNAIDSVKKATKIALLPAVEGGKGQASATSGGAGWYLSANGNLTGSKLSAAGKFIMYITGKEYSTRLEKNYGLPGAVNVGNIDISKFPQLTQDFVKLVNSDITLTPIYDIQMDGSVIDVMETGLQSLLDGSVSPEKLAKQIQNAQDKLSK